MGALQPRKLESFRFGLFPFRSPLLWESRLISLPPGTEMFHFPGLASTDLCIQSGTTGHNSRQVAPFGNPRFKACLAAPRGLSQPTTSFIACQRLGIHRLPFISYSGIYWPSRYSTVKELARILDPALDHSHPIKERPMAGANLTEEPPKKTPNLTNT